MQDICRRLVSESRISADIGINNLMTNAISYYGDIGEYDRSDKMSEKVLRENLALQRMTMFHESIYNKPWNRLEYFCGTDNAEQKDSLNGELEKCIQFARLWIELLKESARF